MGYVIRGRESCSVAMHNCALTLPFLGNIRRPYFWRPPPPSLPHTLTGTPSDQEFLRSPGGDDSRGYLSRKLLPMDRRFEMRRHRAKQDTRGGEGGMSRIGRQARTRRCFAGLKLLLFFSSLLFYFSRPSRIAFAF